MMEPPLLSLDSSPPDGFHYIAEISNPAQEQVIYAPTLDAIPASQREVMRGLIITPGSPFAYTSLRAELGHLCLPPEDLGRLPHLLAMYLEIVRQQELRHQKTLEEHEKGLKIAQKIAKLGNWFWNFKTQDIHWSDEMFHIYGFEKGVIPDISLVRQHILPEDLPIFDQAIELLNSGEVYENIEYRFKRPDGQTVFLLASAKAIYDEAGQMVKLIGILQDVTQTKQAEMETLKLEKQLRHTQKLETIGTLAGGIAHDFNNILMPIMGYADLIALRLDTEHPMRAYLEHIFNGCLRAKELVEQILLFSKQSEKEKKPLSLNPLIQEALKFLRPILPSTIDIQLKMPTSSPWVLADSTQIHQVLVNLCTNAWQAMETAGGTLTIELQTKYVDQERVKQRPSLHVGEYACLTISDTGMGMDEGTLERIFEPFFSTKVMTKGTGLGLSVVHGIVRSHGGDILVYSHLNQGTSFHIYLPMIHNKEEAQVVPLSYETGTESILMVDDDVAITELVNNMLTRLGYQVTSFNVSLQALEHFESDPGRYDLLISDLTMPQMTGSRLAEAIHQIRPDLPILMMTGFGNNLTDEMQKRCGIKQVLSKPFTLREISTAIRSHLQNEGSK